MPYSAPRDMVAHPRNKGRKLNRARRHRLNPGRRSVADRKSARPAEALAKIGAALAGIGVC